MGTLASVSVIGVGIMGGAIARRFLDVGHPLTVFDLDKEKTAALAKLGAKVAASPADAARASEFTVTSLNSAAIVRSAVFGPGGVVEAASPDKMLIDMSSIDPVATVEMAKELRQRTGMPWVDSPLSGGAPKVAVGKLTLMAGGDAADVEKSRRALDSLCANFTHMGPQGAGQTTKMINQVLIGIGFQALAEAIRLAEAGGVDPAKIPAALKGGRADSNILQEFGPKMAARDMTPTGRIDNMLKDLEPVQAFALAKRLPLFLTNATVDLHRMFVLAGIGPLDTVAMMEQFAGFQKPKGPNA